MIDAAVAILAVIQPATVMAEMDSMQTFLQALNSKSWQASKYPEGPQ